uniref:hypothetical protein n=1 Tax=Neisseria weixii TaxID=1853276 RepID=UPI00359F7DE0
GSSGYSAKIGSSGDYAQIGSSGYSAQIGSSGNDAQIGSSGNDAQIQAKGVNAVIAITGSGRVKAGENGVIAIRWFDEQTDRNRIAVGYVGEDLKADTWYEVNSQGEFVEVTK